MIWPLYYFLGLPQQIVINWVTWNNNNVFSHSSGEKFKIMISAVLVPSAGSEDKTCSSFFPSFWWFLEILGMSIYHFICDSIFTSLSSLCVSLFSLLCLIRTHVTVFRAYWVNRDDLIWRLFAWLNLQRPFF